MGRFYSDKVERAIQIIWFDQNPEMFASGTALLEEAIQSGDGDACYFLGRCYAWEDAGVKSDAKKAHSLFRKGVSLGSSLCVLGADRMGELTPDVTAEMKKPLEEYLMDVTKIAEAGEPMAQYAVGLFYFWGDMLMDIQKPSPGAAFQKAEKENAAIALEWFRRSAAQGLELGFKNAFCSVRDGVNGVKKDLPAALRYAESIKNIDLIRFYHDIGLEYENLGKIKDAVRWYQKGADRGEPSCCNNLGYMYLHGEGVEEDNEKAFPLLQKAAEGDQIYGTFNLGRCYCYGWGTPEDKSKAFQLFTKAAKAGHRGAQYFLAQFYDEGLAVQADYKQCFNWALKAVHQGHSGAKFYLAKCYFYGRGIDKNIEKAKNLFQESAEDGDVAEAWRYLGDYYDQGLGVEADAGAAVSCYQKALEGGCQQAAEDIARYKKTLMGKWKRR